MSAADAFPVPTHRFEMAAHAPADRDRPLENQSPSPPRRRFHLGRELVHQRIERHRVARRKISLEQVTRVSSLRCRAQEIGRAVRAGDRHQGRARRAEDSTRNGWRFRPPHELSANYRLYRDYIRRSKGEFTVAKDQYVRLNTGWFSDRSACYLAAGRPVITQETGFTRIFGKQDGLFAFNSLGEIAEAIREINAGIRRYRTRVGAPLTLEVRPRARSSHRVALDIPVDQGKRRGPRRRRRTRS